MAKVCEICGKATNSGRRLRHHHAIGWMFRAPRTNRTWKPNLRKADVVVNGETKKLTVCMDCYKKLPKKAVKAA